ncbi:hypothetical protein [Massilia glaciei]|uniref:hypothetical protein n=1 Tax=Massilia glaciei TaxID=1524097 RepID=UPI00351D4303
MEMRDEYRVEPERPDFGVVEPDLRERMAIAAERVFKNRIESDLRFPAPEDITGMKYSGDF